MRGPWTHLSPWVAAISLAGCGPVDTTPLPDPGPTPRIVFDTDIGNDVDDALALAMLHRYQSDGSIELLGVTISDRREQAAPFVDLVGHHYGHGDVPIGVVVGGVEGSPASFVTEVALAMEGGAPLYPRDVTSSDAVPEATEVLRAVLAAQPDQSVTVVSVGFATNLARLLDSPADAHSALDGVALVARKVRFLSIMAGDFQDPGHVEFNVKHDVPSVVHVAEAWPTTVIWSGFEVGAAVRYPGAQIDVDFGVDPPHPIADAYRAFAPFPYDRPCWDLTSVLVAASDASPYLSGSAPGTVTIDAYGHSTFVQNPSGKHRILHLDAHDRDALAARLVERVRPAGP